MRSWRTWPPRAWALLGALVLFSVAVLSVLYWAQFTGRAGSQRGLVIHNDLSSTTFVRIDGVTKRINAREEETFVVKRQQFPAEIQIFNTKHICDLGESEEGGCRVEAGLLMFSEFTEYADITAAEFRLSIDEQGIHPTTAYRDTPVPATEIP